MNILKKIFKYTFFLPFTIRNLFRKISQLENEFSSLEKKIKTNELDQTKNYKILENMFENKQNELKKLIKLEIDENKNNIILLNNLDSEIKENIKNLYILNQKQLLEFSNLNNEKDGKKIFFQSMGITSFYDNKIKIVQLGDLIILKELKKIFDENNIDYWLSGGTLLGATRNGKFIPWDDDIDIDMLRNDFNVLKSIISKYKDLFIINRLIFLPILNDVGTHEQIRVHLNGLPDCCFVDIFIYEQNVEYSDNFYSIYLNKLVKFKNDCMLIDKINDKEKYLILKNNFLNSLSKEKFINNDGIIWGIENFCPKGIFHASNYYKKSEIFPLKTVIFENISFKCPNDKDSVLKKNYNDFYSFPDDIFSNKHQDISNDDCDKIKIFLESYHDYTDK